MKNRRSKLASLARVKKAPKKKAKARKASKTVSKKALGESVLGVGYAVREIRRWRRAWSTVPGLPSCIRRGRTSDDMWGYAIWHKDAQGTLVSFNAYAKRGQRDAQLRAIRFAFETLK